MAEELKNLIEKIHTEGIKAAEEKARSIEDAANSRAKAVVKEAEKTAERIIAAAEKEAAGMRDAGEAALKQAGRDLLISLRGEINALLGKLLTAGVAEVLPPDRLAGIISAIIEKHSKSDGADDITIYLSRNDLEALEKGFMNRIKEKVRKNIILESSDDIRAGLCISFDGGKSRFDFTDESLAAYLGAYLKPRLAGLIEGAAKEGK